MVLVGHDDVIEDEDEPWKRKKNSYYREHFFPETDPTITKFTVSVTITFHYFCLLNHVKFVFIVIGSLLLYTSLLPNLLVPVPRDNCTVT